MQAPHPSVNHEAELQALERHRARDGDGGSLPASAYCTEGFMALENAQLFGRHWVCIGFVDDVPETGDVRPVSVAGKSLLMLRDEAGAVRVFHNFCRHRGHRLVTEAGKVRDRLVCPYHAWSYRLDGRLERAPHYHGIDAHWTVSRDDGAPSLLAVRTAVWLRLVFVDLSGEAPPLDEWMRPLTDRWKHYDFSHLRQGAEIDYRLQCNWKLAIENFIDFYHVPLVHPGLNQYTNIRDCYFIEGSDLYFGQGTHPCRPDDEATGRLPEFPRLPPEHTQRTEAICVFPNLLLTVFWDNVRAILVQPTGATTCRERVAVFFVGEAALSADLAPVREVAVDRFKEFNEQDIAVVEDLQIAHATTNYDGGRYSPHFDRNVAHFQRRVAQQLVSR